MKANQNGRECAPWCTSDHSASGFYKYECEGERRGKPGVRAFTRQAPYADTPEIVAVAAKDGTAGLVKAVSASGAEDLAALLDVVAGMRKPEIRALAANVRKAAADAFPEKEAEPS